MPENYVEMTFKDAAFAAGCSIGSLVKAMKDGRIKCKVVGKTISGRDTYAFEVESLKGWKPLPPGRKK